MKKGDSDVALNGDKLELGSKDHGHLNGRPLRHGQPCLKVVDAHLLAVTAYVEPRFDLLDKKGTSS